MRHWEEPYLTEDEERALEDAAFEDHCAEIVGGECPDLEDLEAELWTYSLSEAA